MDELLAEMRKFDPEAKVDDVGMLVVKGITIHVHTFEKKGKMRYEIGNKKRPNAKEAAYYIVTEYLMQRLRNEVLQEYVEGMKDRKLPKGTGFRVGQTKSGNMMLILTADSADAFKEALKTLLKE